MFSGGPLTHAQSEILATRDESAIKSEIVSNQQLAEELNEPIIKRFEKWKSSLKRQYLGYWSCRYAIN